MRNAEKVGSTSKKPEKTLVEMLNTIRDGLSELVISDDEGDGEDKDDAEDTELGKLSEDDEPGWVMGTISKTFEYHMESFRQNQMWLDELMQLQWGDAANQF